MLKRKKFWFFILAFVLIFSLAACNGGNTPAEEVAEEVVEEVAEEVVEEVAEEAPAQVTQSDITIGLSVHNDPATAHFWGVVELGARDAAELHGVELISGGSKEPQEQAALIEDYVALGVDGIIVSMANPDALKDAIEKAVAAGIPVITINSGEARSKEFGAITHFGQSEFIAGQGAGEKFSEAGYTKALCVIHEENIALEDRCDGFADTFTGEMIRFSVAGTGISDPAGSLATITDKLTADPDIDAILTLNPTLATIANDAIKETGSSAALGTFDMSADVIDAILAGEIDWAIDQQQYLQGWLPVDFLYVNAVNANVVGGGLPVLTGPGFVDASNAATIRDLAAAGSR